MATRDIDYQSTVAVSSGAGVLAAMGTAGILSVARDQLGQTTPALALVTVVIAAAAAGGRTAGAYTALAASLSFNFWFTKPYLTLRITSTNDLIDTLFLLVVGLAVGTLASARDRHERNASDEYAMLTALADSARLIAAGATGNEVWQTTRRALINNLGLRDATYEPASGVDAPLPRIGPNHLCATSNKGTAVFKFVGNGLALPAGGAELPVCYEGQNLGRVVLSPDPHRGVPPAARRFALALVDLLGPAMMRKEDG